MRHLKTLDMRFPSAQDEAAFRLHVDQEVVDAVMYGAAIAALNGLVVLATRIPIIDLRFYGWATFSFVADLIYTIGSAMIFSLALIRKRLGLWQTWHWERITLGFAMFLLTCVFVRSPLVCRWWGAEQKHIDGEQVAWSLVYEQDIIIGFDVLITAVCLFAPIRSCVLWILPLSAMCLFFAVKASASLTDQPVVRPNHAITLGAFCIFGFVGASRNERHVREKWIALRQVVDREQEVLQQQVVIDDLQTEQEVGTVSALRSLKGNTKDESDSGGSSSSSSSDVSSFASVASASNLDDQRVLWVDVNALLEVKRCNLRFRRLIGCQLLGSKLLDNCVQQRDVQSWFESQFEKVRNETEDEPWDSTFGPTLIKAKGGSKKMFVVFKVRFVPFPESCCPDEYVVRCIVLKDRQRPSGSGTARVSTSRRLPTSSCNGYGGSYSFSTRPCLFPPTNIVEMTISESCHACYCYAWPSAPHRLG